MIVIALALGLVWLLAIVVVLRATPKPDIDAILADPQPVSKLHTHEAYHGLAA